MIRILIADDHAIVRGGLLQLFGLAGDVMVVAQATNGGQVIENLRSTSCEFHRGCASNVAPSAEHYRQLIVETCCHDESLLVSIRVR